MKIGVDAIVEKPFSMEFLLSRVENLITSRKKMIQMISGNVDYEHNEEADSNIGLSSRDVLFLQELNRTIESNFSNPDFGVEDIAALLNISRSSLNRKMRDILNTTANNYIRDKRIEKAEELLRTSSMQVNEICYKVGFTTPSYFIKCFRKKYSGSVLQASGLTCLERGKLRRDSQIDHILKGAETLSDREGATTALSTLFQTSIATSKEEFT